MEKQNYIVATVKSWNIDVFNRIIKNYPGVWHLITDPKELTVERIKAIAPRYIFFPHWNAIVPEQILDIATCVCFHEADLPYGRGGSPIQNLIDRGHRETVISALKMTRELDAGPIYLKRPLSLEGLAEEIFIRTAHIIADMIKIIITDDLTPEEQLGEPVVFKRRTPDQSKLPENKKTLMALFDHIRMLDAEGYPRAFLEYGGFRFEISRPALRTDEIIADIRITKIGSKDDDV